MANPTSNFGWQMPTNTDLVKDLPADFEVFGQAVDTSLMDLKGGTTGQVLSKASNTDMDFTWIAQDDSNAIQNAIMDAKGDLISATAADTPARLASSGVNGDVLTVDTTTATGLKWAAPVSGSLTLIQETQASSASSVSWSSISGSYKQLLLVYTGVFTSDTSDFRFRFNNDSGSNYALSRLGTTGGAVSVTFTAGTDTAAIEMLAAITTTTLQNRGRGFIQIDNYASTTRFKPYIHSSSFIYGANGTYNNTVFGTYASTSAITSIDIVRVSGTGTLSNATSTSFRLYGVN